MKSEWRYEDNMLMDSIKDYSQRAESLGMDPVKLFEMKLILHEMLDIVQNLPPPSVEEQDAARIQVMGNRKKRLLSEEKYLWSSMKEPRYLYVTNGFTIYMLDLKRMENEKPLSFVDGIPVFALPKAATLNLMENGYPVLVDLLRFGSNVFMIGGQEFPKMEDLDLKSSGYSVYKSLSNKHGVNGTSRAIYHLCFDDSNNSIKPSYAINLKEMKSPKFWPIVEEVNGKIHVFDSFHCSTSFDDGNDWKFSHEVKEGDGGWSEVETSGLPSRILIWDHLVVGHRIYAVDGGRCLVFDCDNSGKQSWEMHYRKSRKDGANLTPGGARTVWDILYCTKTARCLGEFGEARSEAGGKLYVIMAFVETLHLSDPNMGDDFCPRGYMEVATYVVDSMGNVICMDMRPFFFEGKTIQLYSISKARIIIADKEGKTMSAIVVGDMIRKGRIIEENYLFVFTFTIEEIYGAASEVRQMMASRLDFGIYGACFERPLVLFDVEGFHIYKVDTGVFEGLEGMEACFQF